MPKRIHCPICKGRARTLEKWGTWSAGKKRGFIQDLECLRCGCVFTILYSSCRAKARVRGGKKAMTRVNKQWR